MAQEIIYTSQAPSPIGPYSQAVKANGFLFVSGQIAIDPNTNQLVQGDISTETRQVMENLRALLGAASIDFSHVVKSSIFLKNMDDFATVNAVYGSYFTANFPARETVEVSRLPKDVRVEISVVAVIEKT